MSRSLEHLESNLAFQVYIKNLFDNTPITDAFINSDGSGLTTNVFTFGPRIIGLKITKGALNCIDF